MPKTIFDPAARAALLSRVDHLVATTPPRWGRFTAPRMVSHLIASVRIALGDESAAVRTGIMSTGLVRYLLIYVMPWPKGAPTAPEMLARAPESWLSDVAALKALLARAAANGPSGTWAMHPAFGRLSPRDWGALIHKHVNHHLTQFGV
jgi:hypothetical protein